MNILTYLKNLGPAVPMSLEKPCTQASSSERMRWCDQGSILINGEAIKRNEEVPYPVESLVFFPKSKKRRTTLL